ncbi:MAG: HD-GYP domain-containing protein [Planctomycetota bacterium]|jgi:HD-GYP domain-containing protein (c-di-GMP phosphodiesterase class II)
MVRTVVDFERVEHFMRELAVTFYNRHLYGADHTRARKPILRLVQALQTYLEERDLEQLSIGVRRGQLEFEGLPLQGGSNLIQMAARLEDREVGGIGITSSLREGSLAEFLDWLRHDDAEREGSFLGIELLEGQEDYEDPEEAVRMTEPAEWEEFRTPLRVYQGAADVLERAHHSVSGGKELDLHEINELTHWTAEQVMRHGSRMLSPLQLLQQDSYTWQHSVNVYLIASTLLRPLAKDQHELARFARAALLHDIGKSLIPESILHKKGRLDEKELAIVRRHPELGAQLLANYRDIDAVDVEVAYCHHMRDNGLGYPVPQFPCKPGPVTNIVQIADMFEALTAHRPYKESLTVEQAVDAIQRTPGMESKQAAMWLLMSHLTVSPPGSDVILKSGERGVVLTTRPDDPSRPMVMLMTDREGRILSEPVAIDLHEERDAHGGAERYVEKVILRFGGRLAAQAN